MLCEVGQSRNIDNGSNKRSEKEWRREEEGRRGK
jgi:hypothetical protein